MRPNLIRIETDELDFRIRIERQNEPIIWVCGFVDAGVTLRVTQHGELATIGGTPEQAYEGHGPEFETDEWDKLLIEITEVHDFFGKPMKTTLAEAFLSLDNTARTGIVQYVEEYAHDMAIEKYWEEG